MIEVKNLTKKYGRFTAVDDISFEVGSGQVVGFLGPNGAGKTSTLRVLTGYHPPTSGTATINGQDVFRDSLKARQSIGYMPENVPLYNDVRVKEYLSFRAHLKGLRGRDARNHVGEALEMCGLQHMRRKMIKTLSKGYRQRVGLADALINQPPLLVLDEPTNGLDPNQIRSIRKLIKRLGEKHTILVSTHILSEVEMVADHVVIIDSGKIKASDTPTNLIKNMRAAGRVELEIRGNQEEIEAHIISLPSVKKVIANPTTADWMSYSILCDSGTDSRERVAQLVQQRAWTIRSLHRHQPTLEEVFVELTRQD
ncbi:ABC transporter ATP-binding protein [Rubritalea marina]|uniref:ABC transporter ATP-binding protein n=1 Tax=Rubritalea marina TaxID=361055 RepID=UPI0003826F8A|nr:ATP-binding cassette domain-containing protein [Rubritalea marina]